MLSTETCTGDPTTLLQPTIGELGEDKPTSLGSLMSIETQGSIREGGSVKLSVPSRNPQSIETLGTIGEAGSDKSVTSGSLQSMETIGSIGELGSDKPVPFGSPQRVETFGLPGKFAGDKPVPLGRLQSIETLGSSSSPSLAGGTDPVDMNNEHVDGIGIAAA